VMDRWDIDLALIPPNTRLADELVRDRGWRQWYCDSTAVILRKPQGSPDPAPTGAPHAGPCGELGRAAP
jgi:hypothetical protein